MQFENTQPTDTLRNLLRRKHQRYRSSRLPLFVILSVAVIAGSACNAITGDQAIPPGISNPDYVRTAEGAAGMAAAAKSQFQSAIAEFLIQSGLLTDELRSTTRNVALGNNQVDQQVAVDARTMPYKGQFSTDAVYGMLQGVRGLSNQAIGALDAYDHDQSVNRRAELYALQGYAVLYLADLFCAGVPLSTLDFGKDFTYKPGSETDDLYRHAIALFDTALLMTSDSIPVIGLASVGKGRALLALGQYANAEKTVKDVSVEFAYEQSLYTAAPSFLPNENIGVSIIGSGVAILLPNRATVVNREGGVGLPYFGDPRTLPQLPSVSNNVNGDTLWYPRKLTKGGISLIRIADGIEAQLIVAEAALAANQVNRWATILNTLRTSGAFTTAVIRDNLGDSIGVDTTYAIGAGKVVGQTTGVHPLIADSTTSATPELRRAVLFHERAFWLYLTGHRQGDLRRLIRRYGVNAYPRGLYPAVGEYGEHVDAPIPATSVSQGRPIASESPNPYFRGCFYRD